MAYRASSAEPSMTSVDYDIIIRYQISDLISRDIRTADTATDWVIANLGTVNLFASVNIMMHVNNTEAQWSNIRPCQNYVLWLQ